MVIVTDGSGWSELRDLKFTSYDFEIGDEENSFEIVILREEWEEIEDNARIFIPDTECGGLVRRRATDTKRNTITIGGYTWRGMLQKAIIEPPPGQDYMIVSGDINDIINGIVSSKFYPVMAGRLEPAGITVENYRFERYCTVYDGLQKMLKSVGRKLRFDRIYEYEELPIGTIAVSSDPIVDYSERIEFSSDMCVNYLMSRQSDGVNHLICLGSGELKNRQVLHLYLDLDGNVTYSQVYENYETVTEVYDYAGAEGSELVQGGTERLLDLANKNVFEVSLDEGMNLGIGDIVGGRDYLSGMLMSAPVIGKIYRHQNGLESVEYKLGDAKGEII